MFIPVGHCCASMIIDNTIAVWNITMKAFDMLT